MAGRRRRRRARRRGTAPPGRRRIVFRGAWRHAGLVGADRPGRSVHCPPVVCGDAGTRALAPGRSRVRGLRRFVPRQRRAVLYTDGGHGSSAEIGTLSLMLRALQLPIGWKELLIRTMREVRADNCLNLAAQLAFYFFLALFPALLFVVAMVSFLPVEGLLEGITSMMARVAPSEAVKIVQDQILKIANDENGGLLTLGMFGTIWSMSSAMDAIISTLNLAYDIQESRPWWRVKVRAILLTLGLAVFIVISFGLVMVGPTLGEKVAALFNLGPAFTSAWNVLRWP